MAAGHALDVRELADHYDKASRAIILALLGFDSISIGRVKLIKREQIGIFLKVVRRGDKELSPYKIGETELPKLAKQDFGKQAPTQPYAAIA